MQDSRELSELPKELTSANEKKQNRRPTPRWTRWELDFIEECFATTQRPTAWLRRIWALGLTEKRLRTMMTTNSNSNLENEEGLAWTWFTFYEGRVGNWVKNKKTKLRLRREREASREGKHPDDGSPPASPTLPRSVTIVHDSTPCKTLSIKGKEPSSMVHRSESRMSSQSISPERDFETCDASVSARLKLEKLASPAVMQEELQRPYPTTESENEFHLTFPVSVCREEPYIKDEPM